MDNLMVFDDQAKKKIGIYCFVPAICFFITLAFYISLLLPLTHGQPEPASVVAITRHNYDILWGMLAVSALISATTLIYCIVMLAKVRNLNSQSKVIWILLLATFVPVSFVLFWYFVVKKEPKYVSTYPNMA